ncbi:hypothetical protein EG68_08533 [Paragonimus skrjabini miyazakii]|uniref:Uncharacterized protein n=1 Tax=Paragonimus skrjabini miyazakii TaxID=59628 RepID=A0A8S9YSY9_9TREM|nr:hypothetical protein EG68_08533 [Paragonimus skrjabini miyazakii]
MWSSVVVIIFSLLQPHISYGIDLNGHAVNLGNCIGAVLSSEYLLVRSMCACLRIDLYASVPNGSAIRVKERIPYTGDPACDGLTLLKLERNISIVSGLKPISLDCMNEAETLPYYLVGPKVRHKVNSVRCSCCKCEIEWKPDYSHQAELLVQAGKSITVLRAIMTVLSQDGQTAQFTQTSRYCSFVEQHLKRFMQN